MPFGIVPTELVIIVIVLALLFGTQRLPVWAVQWAGQSKISAGGCPGKTGTCDKYHSAAQGPNL